MRYFEKKKIFDTSVYAVRHLVSLNAARHQRQFKTLNTLYVISCLSAAHHQRQFEYAVRHLSSVSIMSTSSITLYVIS